MNEEIKHASDPLTVSHATYLWVIVLSMWGGIVRIMREIKFGGKTRKEIVLIFFAELMTSGFSGLVTFFACQKQGFDPMYSAVLVAMSGYMGGRALSWLEEIHKGKHRRSGDEP